MRHALVLVLSIACRPSPAATTSPAPAPANLPPSTGPLSEAEFKALHAAPSDRPGMRRGEKLELAGTKAYLSLPDGKGPFPGIVMIHEWWGLNSNIEHWAD